jgi:hypothetical protein
VKHALIVLAGLWLAGIWVDAVGLKLFIDVLPPPVKFFTQVAALFPRAADMTIEWRAEGYDCASAKFAELDLRPYFTIRADDKENRFDRAMFFYHKEKKVLAALDEYIVMREGAAGHKIGGVLLLSLRIPIPAPGTPEPRYTRVPLADVPASIEHKYWYQTPPAMREARCQAAPGSQP